MPLSPATALVLALHCAPSVAPETLVSVTRVESALEPLAIGVNAPHRSRISPPTREAAIRQAGRLIAQGANLDLGLAQINSKNLGRLGLSVEAAFDPCRNFAAAAKVLQTGYLLGSPDRVGDQRALRVALSYYNTGSADRGFANGYVTKVIAAAGATPPISPTAILAGPAPAWNVFEAPARRSDLFVIHPQSTGGAP